MNNIKNTRKGMRNLITWKQFIIKHSSFVTGQFNSHEPTIAENSKTKIIKFI